ncbi:MAG: Anaerobic sulfite reductase subunit A [Actinobacteria bacterium ADurb.Bin346]|nr:MAG: Anaerobic sulfite reductase subunit A [Actinobacteria bacterium ADurb.Bin346]
MLYKVMDKKDYKDFVSGLLSDYKLIGPKKINEAVHDFVQIKSFEEIDTSYKKTTLPPAKKLLFPSTEELVKYKLNEQIEITSVLDTEEMVLFGINAWDINGMNFLDRLFTTDFIDDNYIAKRKNLIVIGVDTEPSETNFALEMGAEYAKSGFDLFMTEMQDKYFIRVATARGEELLKKYAKGTNVAASDADFAEYDKVMEEYRKKFKVKVEIESFYDCFEAKYDNKQLWEKISDSCFSCGSCNLVCPTCFCFNVKDDMNLDLKTGMKSREWDSCMIPDYGLVAGGHNFRPNRANRLKQRYRCKLKTYLDKFGSYSCVGCGRCVEACLAKINIYEDINTIKEEVSL